MIKKAFTLVELIVVIAVIAIVSSVWIFTFSEYMSEVRDANRITQINNLRDWIALKINSGLLLKPEWAIEVQSNWDKKLFQWYFWPSLIKKVEYSMDWIDPKDKSYFTYSLSANWKYFQLMAFLEEEESYLWVWYENILIKDNRGRIPYIVWSKEIGIFFNDNVVPIHEYASSPLNITSTTTDVYNVVLRNDRIVTSTWWTLFAQMNNVVANYGDNVYWCAKQIYNYANYYIWNPTISNTPRQNVNSSAPCYFSCKSWFTWNGSNCEPWATIIYPTCPTPPSNAIPNTATTITRTWDPVAWDYFPSWDLSYNETPSTTECRFMCAPNFTWNGSSCVWATQTVACTWKPTNNSIWNTISSVEQTWDWTNWTPSSVWVHNTASSNIECRFRCESNYTYESVSNTCVADTRWNSCNNTVLNSYLHNNTITQTWSGSEWLPSLDATHSLTDVPWECRFRCNTNYTYNSWTNTCNPNTQPANCTWNPANSTFHNSSITQTWNWTAWWPSATPIRSATPIANQCSFECNSWYSWNGVSCELATRPMACSNLPANATQNSVTNIIQTWSWTNWTPSEIFTHNTTPSTTECRFTCNANYNYDSVTNTCQPISQTVACSAAPSWAYLYNTTITQTWNWSSWWPNTTSTYSATPPSTTNIASSATINVTSDETTNWWAWKAALVDWDKSWPFYHSEVNSWTTIEFVFATTQKLAQLIIYNRNDSQASRFIWATVQVYNWASLIDTKNITTTQNEYTYNYSGDDFNRVVITHNTNWLHLREVEIFSSSGWNSCNFACNTNYSWNGSACVPATQVASCSAINTPSQVFNTASSITQTWNGTTWTPSNLTTVYNPTASTSECRFRCNWAYTWNTDLCFNNISINGQVRDVKVQSDGKVLIGWNFTTVWWTTRNRIARLNENGSLDTWFNPNSNSNIYVIEIQSDWKILVWWTFGSIWGQTRNRIARLNTNWTADSFNPNSNWSIWAVWLQSDWKVILWWTFTSMWWQTRTRLARVNNDGTLDTSFNININSSIYTLKLQSDWKIIIWWNFTIVWWSTRNSIARLNTNWTLDTSYNPNANSTVYRINIDSLWNHLFGWTFTSIDWISKERFGLYSE